MGHGERGDNKKAERQQIRRGPEKYTHTVKLMIFYAKRKWTKYNVKSQVNQKSSDREWENGNRLLLPNEFHRNDVLMMSLALNANKKKLKYPREYTKHYLVVIYVPLFSHSIYCRILLLFYYATFSPFVNSIRISSAHASYSPYM